MADRDRDLDVNVVADVEFAELGPDFARRVGEPAGVRNRPDPAAADVADDDLLLGELDDKGHGSRVFVAKGDRIPPSWRRSPVRRRGGPHAVSGRP
jgi:hypothetical protein